VLKAFEGLSQSTPSHLSPFLPLSFFLAEILNSFLGWGFSSFCTKEKSIDKISAARGRLWRAEFSIIPPPTQFVNRQIQQKSSSEKSRICAKLPIDISCR
jgi:hypothetical protein